MVKIEFIQTTAQYKKGDIVSCSKDEADEIVAKGFAKYLGEESQEKIFTRLGQAEIFIKKQPLFYDKAGLWWLWNKKEYRWDLTDETDILNLVEDQVNIDTISSKARLEILNALKQVGRRKAPRPIHKDWIQFSNLIVDVNTGNEYEATPEFFIINPIPWKLHKQRFVETPIMDALFSDWVGKDNVKLLYEILAYSLLPDYPLHRLFCFIGSGLNGKSCFLRLLTKFLGPHNVTSTELDALLTSRFEITKLHKKLACIMGETNFNEISKTSVLKKLTGQDPIGFEYKNKTPFDDLNYAKILIATNNLPTTTDKTIGFYRRWTIIDFPNQFSEEEDILAKIPEEEYNILAVKSLFILKDLLTERKFHNEGSIEERMQKYEDKSNPFDKFWKECIVEDASSDISKKQFSERLNNWCKENRFRLLSDMSISKHMKDKSIETIRKSMEWMQTGYGQEKPRYWAWSGIKWKN